MVMKLKLIASKDDGVVLKAKVAAVANGLNLSVEAPKGGAAVPELHFGTQVVRHATAIIRCIGRMMDGHDLHGTTFFESGEVDSWVDWAQLELGFNEAPMADRALEALEKHLSGRTFVVGQRYTLADLVISCSLHTLQQSGQSLPNLPMNVQRWFGTCLANQAFVAVAGAVSAPTPAASSTSKAAAAPAAKATAAKTPQTAKGAPSAASGSAPAAAAAGTDRGTLIASCVAAKERRLPKAPAFAKLKLTAAKDDPCALKACVAARAANVDLAVETPAGGGPAVPELLCGNRTVKYSSAILRCIGRIFEGGTLYGTTFQEAGEIDSWLDWAQVELKSPNPPLLGAAVEALAKHLDGRTFMVGQRYTLADVSLSCTFFLLQHCGAALPALPGSVQRWLGACTANEAFVAVAGKAAVAAPKSSGGAASGGAPAASSTGAPADASSLVSRYSSAVGGRITIKKVLAAGESLIGQTISVCGWVRTVRSQKTATFIKLNDGSCPSELQIVVDPATPGYEALKTGCGTSASLKCTGKLVKSPAKGQTVEMLLKDADDEVVMLGPVKDTDKYALAKGNHSKEFLRTVAHLRPRALVMGAMARVRSSLAHATHEFFRERDFVYVHTPLITAADCEGAGEMFQVTTLLAEASGGKDLPRTANKDIDYSKDFFGKPAYMTVSGQLSVENYCCALSNVYTFGPTFRAENSHTSRHLAEFWMIEPELAFANIFDDMECAEDYLKYCVRYAMKHNRADIDFFEQTEEKGLVARLEALLAQPFARLTYTEAIDILLKESKKVKFQVPIEWGMDLNSEHERYLAEKVYKKPIILYNYPKDIKAFYMRLNDDNKTVAAMDVLVPGIGEVIGGSQREDRLEVLDKRLTEMNLDPQDYWWYRDLRKFGSVPHAGFGLGFERLLMLVTGLDNIRDVIPFPRYPGHADF